MVVLNPYVVAALNFVVGLFIGNFVGKVRASGDPATVEGRKRLKIEDEDDSEATAGKFEFTVLDEMKLVYCIRQDLKMTRGKVAAQCCHATVMTVKLLEETFPTALDHWINTAQKKITLKIKDEKELEDIRIKAAEIDLPTVVISDAGHTQVPAGSETVLAIGPAPERMFQGLTSHLKLY